jgi:hypothetical protein
MDKLKKTDLGVTIERFQHSNITVEPRHMTTAGLVLSYGNRDAEHCLLDVLYESGYLGNRDDSEARHASGLRLREMYYTIYPTGKPISEMGGHRDPFVKDIGSGIDLLEAQYHQIMRMLAKKYQMPAIKVCVEDSMVGVELCLDMLDALWGAFEAQEKREENRFF